MLLVSSIILLNTSIESSAKTYEIYSYNGAELIDINEVWTDKTSYPYAYLVKVNKWNLYLFSSEVYIKNGYVYSSSAGSYIHYTTNSFDNTWVYGNSSVPVYNYPANYGLSSVDDFSIGWCNDTVSYSDGSTFLQASVPLLVDSRTYWKYNNTVLPALPSSAYMYNFICIPVSGGGRYLFSTSQPCSYIRSDPTKIYEDKYCFDRVFNINVYEYNLETFDWSLSLSLNDVQPNGEIALDMWVYWAGYALPQFVREESSAPDDCMWIVDSVTVDGVTYECSDYLPYESGNTGGGDDDSGGNDDSGGENSGDIGGDNTGTGGGTGGGTGDGSGSSGSDDTGGNTGDGTGGGSDEELTPEEEQLETSKGILGKITDFFDGFGDMITGLFVPSKEEMGELFEQLRQFFSDKFGFLFYPFDILIELVDVFLNGNGSTSIVFPGFAIMGYQIWNDISFDLTQYPMIVDIFGYVRLVMGAILAFGFINYLRNFFDKRFGGGGN